MAKLDRRKVGFVAGKRRTVRMGLKEDIIRLTGHREAILQHELVPIEKQELMEALRKEFAAKVDSPVKATKV